MLQTVISKCRKKEAPQVNSLTETNWKPNYVRNAERGYQIISIGTGSREKSKRRSSIKSKR
jgi:hypothetical protein